MAGETDNNGSTGSTTETEEKSVRSNYSTRSGYTSGNIDYNDSGNDFVTNLGLHPLVNFNFMLRVEGIMDVPCKSVGSFTKENEFEYIKEGGLNDYVHMKRKPISKPFTFTVERYVGVDAIDPLPLGAELVLPLLLFVSRYGNKFTAMARTYTFTGCTVISKEYGRLDAEKSGLLTENVTIAYREMVIVDLPSNISYDKPSFKFGSLDNKKAIHSTIELSKEDMESTEVNDDGQYKNSLRATFDFPSTAEAYRNDLTSATDTQPAGGVSGRARINSAEPRKSDMAGKAKMFSFPNDKFAYRYDLGDGETTQPANSVAGYALINNNEVHKADMMSVEKDEAGEYKSKFRAQFKFNGDTTKASALRGNQNYGGADRKITEKSRTEMEKLADENNTYSFKKEFKGGTAVHLGSDAGGIAGHAIVNRNEVRRDAMAKEATFNGKKIKKFEFKKENTFMKSSIGNAAFNPTEIRQKNMAKMAKINGEKSVKYKFSAKTTSMSEKVGNAFYNAKEIRKESMPNLARFNKKKLKKFVFSATKKHMTEKYGNAAFHENEVRKFELEKNAVQYEFNDATSTEQLRSIVAPGNSSRAESELYKFTGGPDSTTPVRSAVAPGNADETEKVRYEFKAANKDAKREHVRSTQAPREEESTEKVRYELKRPKEGLVNVRAEKAPKEDEQAKRIKYQFTKGPEAKMQVRSRVAPHNSQKAETRKWMPVKK